MSQQSQLTRRAGTVGVFTLLSRATGLLRDMVFAALFGAGTAADAFNIAFTIPNMFRRFLAEGALAIAFVPVFSEYQATQSPQEVERLHSATLTLFTLLLTAVVGAGVLFSPAIVKLFAPGFAAEKLELTVFLNRVMFPYLFFMGLASLFISILHTHRHFSAPAAAPILLNLSSITGGLLLSRVVEPPILSMAIGVLVGGFLQAALQLPFLFRRKVRFRFRLEPGHPAVRKMLLLMGPAVFGMAVYQINIAVSRALASLLAPGSVTYIYYSDRFMELPLGIFAVAVATVSLPELSEYAAKNQLDKLRDTVNFALRLTLFLCVPAMVWLATVRVPLVSTLLQRRAFTPQDTLNTARVFFAASFGIWAVAAVRNLVPAFYAMKNTRTPVLTALASFVLNAVAGAILMWPFGAAGLTAANSISSTLNFALLLVAFRRVVGTIGARRLLDSFWRVVVASLLAGAASYPFTLMGLWSQDGQLRQKIGTLALTGLIGGITFLCAALVLRLPELKTISQRILRRR